MAEERSFESPPIPIEIARLRKSYGARLAVDDLTFSVNAGEVVGLLGPNGAGKTTTPSILATLITPDSGPRWFVEKCLIFLRRRRLLAEWLLNLLERHDTSDEGAYLLGKRAANSGPFGVINISPASFGNNFNNHSCLTFSSIER